MTNATPAQVTNPTRETIISWCANALATMYLLWMAFHLWNSTGHFAQMYQGLGAELPASTAFVIKHGVWFYPAVFGILIATIFGKELVIRDKRTSTMITLVVAILGQFMAHWMTTLYYAPLFEMISQLS